MISRLFFRKTTVSLLKLASIPVSVAAPIEKRFVPSFGTYKTSLNSPSCVLPCRWETIETVPIPRAKSSVPPMPLTFQVPGLISLNELKLDRWSDMWCVAPESAYQSEDFRAMKHSEDRAAKDFLSFLSSCSRRLSFLSSRSRRLSCWLLLASFLSPSFPNQQL